MKTIASLPLVGNPVNAFLPMTLADFMRERQERQKGERAHIAEEQPEKPKPRERVRTQPRTKLQPSERQARAPRKDAQERHETLCKLIGTMVETAPCTLDRQVWAGPLTQAAWAEKAGLPLRTFKRLILHPPIVVAARGVGRGKATYLRLGTVDQHDLRYTRNRMAKLWRRHIGDEQAAMRDYRRDYGLICGLTDDLPRGWQVEIFDHALTHWATFCAMAKFEIEVAQDMRAAGLTPSAGDLDEDGFATARRMPRARLRIRFFKFPCLSFLRRFHHVAVSVYAEHLRERGKDVPAALR